MAGQCRAKRTRLLTSCAAPGQSRARPTPARRLGHRAWPRLGQQGRGRAARCRGDMPPEPRRVVVTCVQGQPDDRPPRRHAQSASTAVLPKPAGAQATVSSVPGPPVILSASQVHGTRPGADVGHAEYSPAGQSAPLRQPRPPSVRAAHPSAPTPPGDRTQADCRAAAGSPTEQPDVVLAGQAPITTPDSAWARPGQGEGRPASTRRVMPAPAAPHGLPAKSGPPASLELANQGPAGASPRTDSPRSHPFERCRPVGLLVPSQRNAPGHAHGGGSNGQRPHPRRDAGPA